MSDPHQLAPLLDELRAVRRDRDDLDRILAKVASSLTITEDHRLGILDEEGIITAILAYGIVKGGSGR